MNDEALRAWATEIVDKILDNSYMPYMASNYDSVVLIVYDKLKADLDTVVSEGYCSDCEYSCGITNCPRREN